MNKVLFILYFIVIVSCNLKPTKSTHLKDDGKIEAGITELEVNKEIHNFGKLVAGEIVVCNFEFQNVGSNNLIIKGVDEGCGCLNVETDKKVYPPNSAGNIEVMFNSAGMHGKQFKMFVLKVNTEKGKQELAITADIENKEIIEY